MKGKLTKEAAKKPHSMLRFIFRFCIQLVDREWANFSLDAEVELGEVDAHGDHVVARLLVHVLQIHLQKEMFSGFLEEL